MALPEIKVKISADTKEAEAGFNRVEAGLNDVGNAASRTASRVGAIDAPMRRAARSSGNLRFAVQNASFQLADMATMLEMGIDKSRVFSQQIPQMLGPLGTLGAVLGTVIAIGIPLATTMNNLSESGRDMTVVFGTLQPIMQSIASAFALVGPMMTGALEAVINNIDRIIITASVAAALFAGKWVVGFVAAQVATFSLVGALTALRVAIIRTGFGAMIIGIGELIYQFTRLTTAAGGFGEALGLLKDVAIEVWQRIGDGVSYVSESIRAMSNSAVAFFISGLNKMASAWIEFTWTIADGMNSMFGTSLSGADSGITQTLAALQVGFEDTAAAAQAAATAAGESMSAPLSSVQKIRDLLAGMKDEKITLPDILGVGEDGEDGKGGGKTLEEKLTRSQEQIKAFLDNIKAMTQGSLGDQLGAWGDYFSSLVSLTGSKNERLLALSKAFSAGQALVNAWLAYTEVLKDPTLPWWARIAAAGNVLAAGIGAVNAIKSVSAGGGGSRGAGGAASASATAPEPTRTANINISGDVIGKQTGQQLVTTINEAMKAGYRLNLEWN